MCGYDSDSRQLLSFAIINIISGLKELVLLKFPQENIQWGHPPRSIKKIRKRESDPQMKGTVKVVPNEKEIEMIEIVTRNINPSINQENSHDVATMVVVDLDEVLLERIIIATVSKF